MSSFKRVVIVLGLIILLPFVLSSNAYSAETSLMMISDSGDFVGQGLYYFYSLADGTFTAQFYPDNAVIISFLSSDYSHWWYLDFAAPNEGLLTVGTYSDATRYLPAVVQNIPTMYISGNGRGCNTLTGSFEVKEISYGTNNDMQSFWATFEQHCEGSFPALRGEIRFNANAPNTTTAISSSSNPLIVGQSVTFTATVASTVGTPNGNVAFMDGAIALGTGTLSGSPATATFTTSALSAGTHLITAVYGGENTFDPSTSDILDQTVLQGLAIDLFPLYPGNVWEYIANGSSTVTTTVLRKKVLVGGAPTSILKSSNGLREFCTNDSAGFRLHREFQPDVYIPNLGYVDLEVTLIPPLRIAASKASIGQTFRSSGIARTNSLPIVGVLDLPYASKFTVEGLENVNVPAGNFATVRIEGRITIQGQTQSLTYNLAEGIGPVKTSSLYAGIQQDLELTAFTPGSYVKLLTPNGGEAIPSGGKYTITWEASKDLVSFKIFYSMDNGLTWILLTPTCVDEASFEWEVPKPISNVKTCLVKVVGYDLSGTKVWADKSADVFTIEVVSITSPIRGETLSAGSPHKITWETNTAGSIDRFKLLYTKNNGITWTVIHEPVPEEGNPGSYLWDTIPVVIKPKTKSRIKLFLKDASGNTIGKALSDFFTVK